MLAAPPVRAGLAPSQLRRVRDVVEERLDRDLSLEDLAAAAGLSAAPTSPARSASPPARRRTRICASGASPGRASCWPASARPVVEIAGLTGFRSQSHLGRVFKNATGLTPAEYRRHVRG